jgi:ribulose kinase
MRTFISRFWNTALLGAALIVPVGVFPSALQAQDHSRSYHDREHNDDHQWNKHEDRAYRIYVKQNHHRYRNFSRLRDEDQQAYWGWRHEHSDALLKIDIR